MSDKLDAISQSKEIEQVLKQEKLHEKAEEAKKEQAQPEVKADAKEAKADAKPASKDEKKDEKKAEKKEEKKKKFVLERVYTVPLLKAYKKSRSHRGRIAVSLLRQYVAKHAKAASLESVSIDTKVNSAILVRGSRNPPKKLRVLVQKDEAGKVVTTLAA